MSYEKTTWQTGDVITAEKLNNIEDGIVSASSGEGGTDIFVVPFEYDEINLTYATNINFSDILEALSDNKIIIGAIVHTNNDCVVDCELSHRINPKRMAASAPISSFDFIFDINTPGQGSPPNIVLYFVKKTITINNESELSVIQSAYSVDATVV